MEKKLGEFEIVGVIETIHASALLKLTQTPEETAVCILFKRISNSFRHSIPEKFDWFSHL